VIAPASFPGSARAARNRRPSALGAYVDPFRSERPGILIRNKDWGRPAARRPPEAVILTDIIVPSGER